MPTFFTDYKDAVVEYPVTGVELSIADQQEHNGAGSVIEVGEIWKCKIQLRNHGWLDMDEVTIHVNAYNGIRVDREHDGDFSSGGMTVGSGYNQATNEVIPMTVNSGSTRKTAWVYFTPTAEIDPADTILEFHIAAWDARLENLHARHSDHSWDSSAEYVDEVA